MSQPRNHEILRLEIGDIWIDPPGTEISSLPHAFTNIDADVRIFLGDRLFLDAELCVVEFAGAIRRWLSAGGSQVSNFRFESSDDEEPNILSFDVSDDGIRLHSAWQKFTAEAPLPAEPLTLALADFVQEVMRRCRDDLGVDVEGWIGAGG